MQAGFTAIVQESTLSLTQHGSTALRRPNLISAAKGRGTLAVLVGCLYYRTERLAWLQPRLSEPALEACRTDDAALVLASFEQFGPAALEELEGDYAVAVWDGASRRLYGARDPMGGYPLFWTSGTAGFALGTTLGPLLAIHGRRALNRTYLADYLTMFGQRNEGPGEECVYEGIHRVLPGAIVVLDGTSGKARQRVYWDWRAQARDPGTDQLGEAAEQYAQRVRAAVAERLRGQALAHLSGGMDSTAIALLARNLIQAGRATGPLLTASLVYERLPKLARERPFIEEVLRGLPDVVTYRIQADDLLDYDAFADAPPHDEPYAGLWRLQVDRALIEVAHHAGAGTVLTGVGADEVCGAPPYHLADLLRRGRFCKAWHEAACWARAHNSSVWMMLRQFAFIPLGWSWLTGLRRDANRLLDQSDISVPPWIDRGFAQQYALRQRLWDRTREVYRTAPSTLLSATTHGLRSEAGDPVRWALGVPRQVAIAHPFLDSRVLTLGLGIQGRLMFDPDRQKPLLAEAFRDLLPEPIRRRRAKGHFDEVYYLGLARNLSRLETLVREAPLDDLGLFDKKVLAGVLEEASLAGPDGRKLQRLDHTLALLYWLRHEKDWCCTPVGTTTVHLGGNLPEPADGLLSLREGNLSPLMVGAGQSSSLASGGSLS